MTSQEYRVTEVNDLASKLVLEGHPERETILKKKEVNYNNSFVCVCYVINESVFRI